MQGDTNADPARLAAQVVSGIGSLGAGTIMKEGLKIRGLITAASLWVVSGVGLAVGAAYYISAILTTLLAFFTLTTIARVEKRCSTDRHIVVNINMYNRPGQIGLVGNYLGTMHANITDIRIEEKNDAHIFLRIEAGIPPKVVPVDVIIGLTNVEGVISANIE